MATKLKKTERFERWLTTDPLEDCIFFRKTWKNKECICECTVLNAPYCGLEVKPCRFYKNKEQAQAEERKLAERQEANEQD